MFWSLVCVDGTEGPEADSRESGATGLELTTSSMSCGVVFRLYRGSQGSQFPVLRPQLAIVC